ncbi:hypothetical protein PYCCODRAFT_668056 [Trametes coccinea BRFM310]|uniref:Uncharacterized protein n=1 Tax=Trametes coccinea (strain BRFM310) TaxID=1353009 RepID=A0A1Y2IK47_TRAC3|nr:hypothetical protein PYCCODRAFT_668056 [Trametes coccinea BRFM310]
MSDRHGNSPLARVSARMGEASRAMPERSRWNEMSLTALICLHSCLSDIGDPCTTTSPNATSYASNGDIAHIPGRPGAWSERTNIWASARKILESSVRGAWGTVGRERTSMGGKARGRWQGDTPNKLLGPRRGG